MNLDAKSPFSSAETASWTVLAWSIHIILSVSLSTFSWIFKTSVDEFRLEIE